MPDYQSAVPQILRDILSQEKLTRNEICCKLRELITLMGGGPDSTVVLPGIVLLTGAGTATFTTATTLQGTQYTSVSVSVISLTTGTVTVTDALGTTNISYPGYSSGWTGAISTHLSIHVTGDAVAIITYSAV